MLHAAALAQAGPSASGQPRATVTHRVVAKLLDFILMAALAALLPYPLGPLAGFAYSILGDGLGFGPFRGQSVGKKLMRIRVYNVARGAPGSLRDSAFRNAPVGVATFF